MFWIVSLDGLGVVARPPAGVEPHRRLACRVAGGLRSRRMKYPASVRMGNRISCPVAGRNAEILSLLIQGIAAHPRSAPSAADPALVEVLARSAKSAPFCAFLMVESADTVQHRSDELNCLGCQTPGRSFILALRLRIRFKIYSRLSVMLGRQPGITSIRRRAVSVMDRRVVVIVEPDELVRQ